MHQEREKKVVAVAAAVLLAGTAAPAATYTNVTYNGASGGDFATAGNWDLGRVPGTPDGDTNTFDYAFVTNTAASLASDLSGNTDLGNVYVNNSTLTINSGGYLYQDQAGGWDKGWLRTSNNSTVNINSGGTIDAYGANLNGGQMTVHTGGAFIARNHYQELLGGVEVNLQGGLFAGNANPVFIGNNGGGATVNLTDGVLRNRSGVNIRNGSLHIGGGDVYAINVKIGESASYNTAMIDQTGGNVYLASKDGGYIGVGDKGDGLYQISGGTIAMSPADDIGTQLGHGDGIRNFWVGNGAGTGRFRIIGNDATIDLATSSGGSATRFFLGANGTLEWVVDDSTVSPINVFGSGAQTKQSASLAGVIDLNLALGYTPAGGATYDLLHATDAILDAGYSLDPADAATWSLAIVGTAGSGQTLQATYIIPEPATAGLLSLMAVGLLLRRNG